MSAGPDAAAQAMHEALNRAEEKARDARAVETAARCEAEKWEMVAEQLRGAISASQGTRPPMKKTGRSIHQNKRIEWLPLIAQVLSRPEHADLGPTKARLIDELALLVPQAPRLAAAQAVYNSINSGRIHVEMDRCSLVRKS
jgi:hypothetical protein